jgi:hypothetical protein
MVRYGEHLSPSPGDASSTDYGSAYGSRYAAPTATNAHAALALLAQHGLLEDAATLVRRLMEISIQATYIGAEEDQKLRNRRAGHTCLSSGAACRGALRVRSHQRYVSTGLEPRAGSADTCQRRQSVGARLENHVSRMRSRRSICRRLLVPVRSSSWFARRADRSVFCGSDTGSR